MGDEVNVLRKGHPNADVQRCVQEIVAWLESEELDAIRLRVAAEIINRLLRLPA